MASYLSIAETILEGSQRPLSAQQILDLAYMNGLVTKHLYGRTQHKTLQARLSEDILKNGSKSAFCRTEPGIFFLRKFLSDGRFKEQYQEYYARRRERDLHNEPVLTINNSYLDCLFDNDNVIPYSHIKDGLSFDNISYLPYESAMKSAGAILWSFVVVYRECSVLSYRQGRYREHRDSFVNRQTIGFTSALTHRDRSMFDQHDYGAVWGGVGKTITDLGIPPDTIDGKELYSRSSLEFLARFDKGEKSPDVIAVVTFECPAWFEPTKKRLAINDPRWLDLRNPVNHIEDFDPWSRTLLDRMTPVLEKYSRGVG